MIAAVVVLYNPDMNVVDNINSYINQVERIYVIDNSDKIENPIVEKILMMDKVEYFSNGKNIGIAAALNIGAKKAITDGFKYLLTMDQDSEASPDIVRILFKCLSQNSQTALVAPIVKHRIGRNIDPVPKESYQQTLSVWTSGNLVDLKIFQLTGGYKEDFFIDYVDHDFCLKVHQLGYKIYICHDAVIKHNLGKTEEVNLFFRKVYPTNHSALRHYYRTRNRFYLKKYYQNIAPDFFKLDDKEFWKSFLKAILFEKKRIKKIKYFIWGYIDYRKNRLGKFSRI